MTMDITHESKSNLRTRLVPIKSFVLGENHILEVKSLTFLLLRIDQSSSLMENLMTTIAGLALRK